MSPYYKRQIKYAQDKISRCLEQRVKIKEAHKEREIILPEEAFLDAVMIHAILHYTKKFALKENSTLKGEYCYVDANVDTSTNPEDYANKTRDLFENLTPNIKRQLVYHYLPKALIKHVA